MILIFIIFLYIFRIGIKSFYQILFFQLYQQLRFVDSESLRRKGQVFEMMGSHIEGEEMSRSEFSHHSVAALAHGIVDGRSMEMAIPGVEGEAIQFRDGGEGILALSSHEGAQRWVDRAEVLEPPATEYSFEEEVHGDLLASMITVALDKITPGARITQASRNPHFQEVEIGQIPTIVLPLGLLDWGKAATTGWKK